ncbi:S26 family signal peptidase [Nocardiopsis sp. NPDC006139]|uniref:S26 family signal peptidase n=1 Tax=Nocardiopsis TaxID=2013 RepID=UPI0033A7600B
MTAAGWLAAAALLPVLAAVYLRGAYVVVTVDGQSMAPALAAGDRVLVRRGRRGLERGTVVVVGRPSRESGWRDAAPLGRRVAAQGWYIKRVAARAGEDYPAAVGIDGPVPAGHLALLGDNTGSIDSRHHGPCPEHQVLGVVVRRLGPPPQTTP